MSIYVRINGKINFNRSERCAPLHHRALEAQAGTVTTVGGKSSLLEYVLHDEGLSHYGSLPKLGGRD